MNSTLNRQTGNGRWGAVCGSGLAASALCVNIIYAPLQWHHVNLTLHILTEIKQPFRRNQDESFIHCSNPLSAGDVSHGATWLGDRYREGRGDRRRQRSSAAMQVQGLKTLFSKTSLSLILSVWICYLRRKRGNQGAGWRTLTIAVWLTSRNFRDLEILSSGEKQQNSKKTWCSMFQ